jgi:hypothetical protein
MISYKSTFCSWLSVIEPPSWKIDVRDIVRRTISMTQNDRANKYSTQEVSTGTGK